METTFIVRLLLTVVFTAAILTAIWLPARAHSPEHFAQMGEEKEKWLRGLQNDNGISCCDGRDGYDAIYDTKDGSYRVLLYGSYWVVPDAKVLKVPNKIGVAQVWYSTLWSSDAVPVPTPQIRCFIPGSGI